MKYEKVIIIGAPRSGTNMLRDLLVELPGVGTWPCDEINYIWRHGNVRYQSDAFEPEMATPGISEYIQKQFDEFAGKHKFDVVVEKTCANSLRVGFVNQVVPGAKYIFIVRDGLDVVGSALLRWKAELDIGYLLKKARYVPVGDLPYYATRYLWNHIYRLVSGKKRLAFWGPALDGMDGIVASHTLEEVCALQWAACVDAAEGELRKLDPNQVIRVSYEKFVSNPVEEFERVSGFLGRSVPAEMLATLPAKVSSTSVGKGRAQLGADGMVHLRSLVNGTLTRYGY